MNNNIKFNLPAGYDLQGFINILGKQYAVKKGPDKDERISFYDTFDWRLYNRSLVLYESDKKLCLRELNKSEIISTIQITSIPAFIWEFPEGDLKEHLVSIIEMRCLLRLFEAQSRSTPYNILNKNEKTVLQMIYKEIQYFREKNIPVLSTYLLLRPIKGYNKYIKKISGHLGELGLTGSRDDGIYFKGLEVVDKKATSYSTKVDIQLDPLMRSDDAVKTIFLFLLQVIRINEAYIEKDLDTEFVHDFRVAIRRTRSALGQIKYVFPSRTTERFKKDFSFVGKLSNELRDLDVYLLNEDVYKAKLLPAMRDDIKPMFDYLREKRSKAFLGFINSLNSKQYKKILKDWETFLNKPHQDSITASNAGVPVIDLARKRIYKKYKSVVKTGNLIIEKSDDKMLHVLRIHCKKLRYLMEFFSSLFPKKKINRLIKQLKKLQDNLGDFNDLCVQEEYILKITEELPTTHGQPKKTLVAIGSLVGALKREREMVKDAFAKTFMDFASPSNKELFRELFTP